MAPLPVTTSCPRLVQAVRRGIAAAERQRRGRFRPAFSFTEILFAIMILGIGFIMVAAIFPVAIRQTQASGEETVAATVAKGGVNYLEKYANNFTMPATASATAPPTDGTFAGQVWSFRDSRNTSNGTPPNPYDPATNWKQVSQNLILPSDARYAWVPMYRRDSVWAGGNKQSDVNYAQVIVIGVQVRNRPLYSAALDLKRYPGDAAGDPPASLEPLLTTADLTPANTTTGAPSTIAFTVAADAAKVAEGTYVVVSDDGHAANQVTSLNGHIYRVGLPTATAGQYELAPGNDMAANEPASPGAKVFIVGRGYNDPANPGAPPTAASYGGPPQDIAVYTTFVKIN